MSGLLILRALRFRVIQSTGRVFINKESWKSLASSAKVFKTIATNHENLLTSRSFTSASQKSDSRNENILDTNTYERVCNETLDTLCDYFEELIEDAKVLSSSDVTYGDGVLTINLGKEYGTYVINRQTPNKQIWLSSPTSGPKRYDFVATAGRSGRWIYKHNGESLHQLLQRELQEILRGQEFDFSQLVYGD
ncbi:frataxin homolog, mitochondrial [Ceratitis capitata]|uniref:frataxin homolog, mitochondrial n=1 Tax=Ceratitis capitata TaxID=7213 RepID=UPI000329C8F5|nr:frataxin homolog, mitochondrial [Ceratitis capitata]